MVGGKDLASLAPGCAFYGKKGLLIPQIRPFRFHTRHAWDLLKPGEQGCPARSATRRGDECVREPAAGVGQLLHVRRADVGRSVRRENLDARI